MIRTFMIAAASAAVLALSATAFAQQPGQYGTADEAGHALEGGGRCKSR
jgi:predicted outer membrane protein